MSRKSSRFEYFRNRIPLDLVEAAKGKHFTFMSPYAQGDEAIVVNAKAKDATVAELLIVSKGLRVPSSFQTQIQKWPQLKCPEMRDQFFTDDMQFA